MFRVTLVLVALGCVAALDQSQLEGFKELLVGLPSGVFATCKMVLFSEQVDYDTADESCESFDIGGGLQEGNLATVSDEEKNSDLTLLLEMAYPIADQPKSKWGPTRWVWAGLRKVRNNGLLQAVQTKYKASDWEWATGAGVNGYTKWFAKSQPDQRTLDNGEDQCEEQPKCYQNQMRINHLGLWDDTFKFKLHPYACDYQGKYILSAKWKSWTDAKASCEAAGLILAKVRSAEEVVEMQTAIEYFLGPKDNSWKKWDSNNWLWLGGTDAVTEGTWTWTDGEPVGWEMPWITKAGGDNAIENKKKQINIANGQDALKMNREGLFDDSFHLEIVRPFACQCPGT